MSTVVKFPAGEPAIRDDFAPKEAYTLRDFAALEAQRVWPRTWQVACREKEICKAGDYVTYNVLDESIIVVRTVDDQIKAFHNVCQHRGRRLAEGCGHTNAFMCRYHGWTWKLDGSLAKVLAREEWVGCPDMRDEDIRLKDVKVDTWGGFVFVNMDPDARQPIA